MKLSGGYRLLIVAATFSVAAARPQDDNLRRYNPLNGGEPNTQYITPNTHQPLAIRPRESKISNSFRLSSLTSFYPYANLTETGRLNGKRVSPNKTKIANVNRTKLSDRVSSSSSSTTNLPKPNKNNTNVRRKGTVRSTQKPIYIKQKVNTRKTSTINKPAVKRPAATKKPARLRLSTTTRRSSPIKHVKLNATTTKPSGNANPNLQKKGNKRKTPIIHKIVSKWSDKPIYNELNQSFYQINFATPKSPTPDVEVTSYSPQYAINFSPDSVENAQPIAVPDSNNGLHVNYASEIADNYDKIHVDVSDPNSAAEDLHIQIVNHSPVLELPHMETVPHPNPPNQPIKYTGIPNVEVSSHDPQFSTNSLHSAIPVSVDATLPYDYASASPNPGPTAVLTKNEFQINGAHNAQDGIDCPSVHITNSVHTPKQKQGCADLNIVINSHIHQNVITDRAPIMYDAQEDPVVEAAEDEIVAADAPLADPAADAPPAAASPASESGFPSLPSLPSSNDDKKKKPHKDKDKDKDKPGIFEQIKGLIDIGKAIFEVLKWLKYLIAPIFAFIPIVILAKIAIGSLISLTPWVLAPFLLAARSLAPDEPTVYYHTHVHRPKEDGGWHWSDKRKSWTVPQPYRDRPRSFDYNAAFIMNLIENFAKRYYSATDQSWKNRKRNKR